MSRRAIPIVLLLAAACASPTSTPGGGSDAGEKVSFEDVTPPDVPAGPDTLTMGPRQSFVVAYRGQGAQALASLDPEVSWAASRVVTRFSQALNGAVLELTPEEAQALGRQPDIDYVEEDAAVSAIPEVAPASSLLWGLDRIDQRALPLNTIFTPGSTGAGVSIYVLDTGILRLHSEFGDRVVLGFSAFPGDASDCQGHGTHVAGTAGGGTVGVARGARLIAVKVLGCNGSGTFAGIINGIDNVIMNKNAQPSVPAVLNMSLGGGASQAVDDAVARATAAGITVVNAAGNSNQNACGFSPARAPTGITVGASTAFETRSSFSNWGPCVHIFAPGSGIRSAVHTGTQSYDTWNGTSMAAPHVAGVAALLLGRYPSLTPAQVKAFLLSSATSGALGGDIGTGSPNRLLFIDRTTIPDGAIPPSVTALRLTPGRVAVFGGESVTFQVTEVLSNGTTRTAASPTYATSVSGLSVNASSGVLVAPNTTGPITVTATSGGRSATATVTVTAVSELRITPSDIQVLPGAVRTVTAGLLRVGGGLVRVPSPTWSSPNGTAGAVTNGSRFTASTTLGTHSLIAVHQPTGLADTIRVRVVNRINRAPTPAIRASCVGRTCTFNGSTTRDDTAVDSLQLTWRVNDEQVSTGRWSAATTMQRTFTAAGTFIVRLHAVDVEGDSAVATVRATVR
ncbi:MAG: S8 family serine peptidase [Gemmatimonadales bacterium]|nr:S8 family serine peptidase [Gemmatimonadales bacterium]